MNQDQTFQTTIFKQSYVEHILIDGEVWFKAKQVAQILEYKEPDQAIRNHVDNEDKKKLSAIYQPLKNEGAGILGNQIMINESGLYSLILRSKKQEAKEFSRWVTKEVLPKIRTTGRYENIELRRQLEEANKTVQKQDKLIDWYMDHQTVEDKYFQKLPPKKMEYIPNKKRLEEPELKQRIIKDMLPFLSNPYDFVYIPRD